MTTARIFCSRFTEKWDACKYITPRHQCSPTTKWLSPLKMSNLYGNFENEIFNSPHVLANFPHFFTFLDDLDLVDDLDLWLKVTKKSKCLKLWHQVVDYRYMITLIQYLFVFLHPIIHTFLKISRRKNQIVMTLTFLVTFKSNLSFQNVN